MPGRTDNEIKNYWRTHFKKKTKTPSDAAEKARIRSSRRQQFQQQQQQLKQQQVQQQQQQQQQFQFNLDMKGIINLLEENNHRVPSISQEAQEMASMYPNTSEQQDYFYSMFNVNDNNVSAPECLNEEILWDGLWNLDDVLCNFNAASATSKATLHNLVAPFC